MNRTWKSTASQRIKVILLFLAFFCCFRSYAASYPKLTVVVVVSKMNNDYFQLLRNNFTDKGFNLLYDQGAVYKNATFSTAFTQSAPCLATLATGTVPSEHGIVADQWYDRTVKRTVGSCEDDDVETFCENDYTNALSPRFLVGSTVADELFYVRRGSKVISISITPEPAILLAGHNTPHVYWFDTKNGNFTTNKYYTKKLPTWVEKFNDKNLSDLYLKKEWKNFLPKSKFYKFSSTDSAAWTGEDFVFNKANAGMKTYKMFLESPYANNLLKDFALTAIVNESLGQKNNQSDILYIYFGAQESIAKKYGVFSLPWEDAYYRLDSDIGHLLSSLDNLIGRKNFLFVLTSDGGTEKNLRPKEDKSRYFSQYIANVLLGAYLKAKYGKNNWLAGVVNRQIYLDISNIQYPKDVFEIETDISEFLKEFEGVKEVVKGSDLKNRMLCSTYLKPYYDSYFPGRSGDMLIMLEPYWGDVDSKTSHMGTPYLYHTHVPLIFYGFDLKRQYVTDTVEMAGVAPTLSDILFIPRPLLSKYRKIIPICRE